MAKRVGTDQLSLPLGELSTGTAPVRDREEKDRLMEEWRQRNLPTWRRILQESIETQDRRREKFARYMLGEVLQDPGYRGP
jgi:hypothetical protein